MSSQITDTLFMVRPISFRKNEQTAVNNYFQQDLEGISSDKIQDQALAEFDAFVEALRSKGVNVVVFDDKESEKTPDSIFPNNWISLHEDGTVITYPMYAENRRLERREEVVETLAKGFKVERRESLVTWEEKGLYLEGTGSMILDRPNKIVYAAISERTNEQVLADFCEKTGFTAVKFSSYQSVGSERKLIYHTNVMMALGDQFAIICLDCIDDQNERGAVIEALRKTNKEIIEITEDQVNNFAGNMLQVKNSTGDKFTVMSEAAFKSLTTNQIESIKKYGGIIQSPIPTIETLGGGGVRCMMAEVFLPKNLINR